MTLVQDYFENEGITCYVPFPYREDISKALVYMKHPRFFDSKDITQDEERISTKLHLMQVALSNVVYIVNPTGIFGLNTAVEIGSLILDTYKDKELFAMKEIKDESLKNLIVNVKSPGQLKDEIISNPIGPVEPRAYIWITPPEQLDWDRLIESFCDNYQKMEEGKELKSSERFI
jgi:hypothetical protein